MSTRLIEHLGVLLVLGACGCVMEHAQEVGFIDRAAAKDTREMTAQGTCLLGSGTRLERNAEQPATSTPV